MKSFIKNISIICGVLIISDTTIAQQQGGTSDISITALTLTAITRSQKVPTISKSENPTGKPVTIQAVATDTLKCTITLSNTGNVTTFGKLVVVLPAMVDVQLASLPANGKVFNQRGISAWPGYVEFSPVQIGPYQQGETFEFTFTKSALGNNISAFVFSTVPDTNSANNYKTAVY